MGFTLQNKRGFNEARQVVSGLRITLLSSTRFKIQLVRFGLRIGEIRIS